jgi:alkaline phosphatase D
MPSSRREFLKLMARAAAASSFVTLFDRARALAQSQVPGTLRRDTAGVFDLSIASGDPSATGVVLWTHLRPDAVISELPLQFQVARDPAFAELVIEGAVPASAISAARDYTVSIDLEGRLSAGQTYYYRFVYGDVSSNVGRCRTLPTGSLARLRLGLLTCQDYTNGYYGALRHLAEDDSIDFVVHLGDFIYESAGDPSFQSLPFEDRLVVLPSGAAVSQGLDDYRAIYRTYRADVWLQRALEAHTFIITHDDHETANDCYWDYELDTLGAPDHPFSGDSSALKRLKLESQRAWLEYIPARLRVREGATHPHDYYESYRSFRFGDLMQLNMLDTRTYREPHPCGDGRVFERYLPLDCDAWRAEGRSMLGDAQRSWLSEKLGERGALWNVLGNQTFFAQLALGSALPINVDAWDGYDAERRWLTQEFRNRETSNPVVLTGDLHSYIAAELKVDYNNLNPLDLNNYAGVEFMTPSVTTGALFESIAADVQGDPALLDGLTSAAVFLTNPHIRFFESRSHGYSVLQLTRNYCEWTAYAIDKDVDPEIAQRTTLARMRKYTYLPTLVPQSTG